MRSKTSFVLLSLTICGCGTADHGEVVPTVPASGTLTFQGRPLADCEIWLHPTDSKLRPASGKTDSEGRFKLGTNVAGDGAQVGQHKVSVSPPTAFFGEAGKEEIVKQPAKPPFPKKFSDPSSSGISVEIPAGGKSDLNIDLK